MDPSDLICIHYTTDIMNDRLRKQHLSERDEPAKMNI